MKYAMTKEDAQVDQRRELDEVHLNANDQRSPTIDRRVDRAR